MAEARKAAAPQPGLAADAVAACGGDATVAIAADAAPRLAVLLPRLGLAGAAPAIAPTGPDLFAAPAAPAAAPAAPGFVAGLAVHRRDAACLEALAARAAAAGAGDVAVDVLAFAVRGRARAWRAGGGDAAAADLARALTDLGNALRGAGDPKAALEAHEAARHVHAVAAAARGARGRDGWLLPSLFNVGLVEAQLGRHDAAVASFGAALALARRVGDAAAAATGAGQESEIPNFKGSYLGRFPLVSADSWTSDHLSERSRRMDAFSGTRARGTRMLKRT
jgi:tetratricopeptide (TPR) repeat protein